MIKNSFMTGIYDDDYDSCDNEYVDDSGEYEGNDSWMVSGLGICSFAHRSFAHLLISLKSNEQL